MFNVKLIVCSVVAMFVCFASTQTFAAQSEILLEEGTITGVVVDASTDEPISGVEVELERSDKSAETNADGEFTINNLEAGVYTLVVEVEGYETWTQQIELTSDEVEVEVKLQPSE
jgi:5-hydroxyisourate hydrolase-like protein (transthyretin family)